MTRAALIDALAVVVSLAWLPIAWRFLRDYLARPEDERHPASLAIVSTIAVLVFHALSELAAPAWTWSRTMVLGAELVVIATFALAFKRGQKKRLVRGRGGVA